MSEDVYVNTGTGPDLTKKIRFGRGERQMEMEERGAREEGIDNIYLTPDDLDPIYTNADNLDSGTQQDAAQKNTAQEQHGGENRYIAAAVCVGLLCLLLLAGVIALVILFNKDRNHLRAEMINLMKDRERLNATNYNLSKEMEELHHLFGSNNWRCLGNSCYRVPRGMRKWKGARRKCDDDHSHLLVINSNEEKKFILKLIPKERGPVWIGLSTNDNGEWQWVDGTPLTPQDNMFQDDWQSDVGETSGMDRRCAVASHEHQEGWNASPCDVKMLWMCEKEL